MKQLPIYLIKYYGNRPGIYQSISGDNTFSSPEPKFDSFCHNQASLSDDTNSEKNDGQCSVVQMRKKEQMTKCNMKTKMRRSRSVEISIVRFNQSLKFLFKFLQNFDNN